MYVFECLISGWNDVFSDALQVYAFVLSILSMKINSKWCMPASKHVHFLLLVDFLVNAFVYGKPLAFSKPLQYPEMTTYMVIKLGILLVGGFCVTMLSPQASKPSDRVRKQIISHSENYTNHGKDMGDGFFIIPSNLFLFGQVHFQCLEEANSKHGRNSPSWNGMQSRCCRRKMLSSGSCLVAF